MQTPESITVSTRNPDVNAARQLVHLVLLFWAVWFALALGADICDALKGLGVLSPEWRFASGNWPSMIEVTRIYRMPTWTVALMMVGVLLWESLLVLLFARALAGRSGPDARLLALRALTVAVAFSGALLIADEVFIAHQFGGTHFHMLTAQLATIFALYLPSATGAKS